MEVDDLHEKCWGRGEQLLWMKVVLEKKRHSTLRLGGTLWRSWLRHCATSRKVAGSIPDGFIGIFH